MQESINIGSSNLPALSAIGGGLFNNDNADSITINIDMVGTLYGIYDGVNKMICVSGSDISSLFNKHQAKSSYHNLYIPVADGREAAKFAASLPSGAIARFTIIDPAYTLKNVVGDGTHQSILVAPHWELAAPIGN